MIEIFGLPSTLLFGQLLIGQQAGFDFVNARHLSCNSIRCLLVITCQHDFADWRIHIGELCERIGRIFTDFILNTNVADNFVCT